MEPNLIDILHQFYAITYSYSLVKHTKNSTNTWCSNQDRERERERERDQKIDERTDLSFSTGRQPRSMLHTGQQSISSSESFSYMHFLQTGLKFGILCVRNGCRKSQKHSGRKKILPVNFFNTVEMYIAE